MNKYLRIFLLLCGSTCIAQLTTSETEVEYECRQITLNVKNNSLILNGNVNFSSPRIKIKEAKQLIWKKDSNEIIVSGIKDFEMHGDSHLIIPYPSKKKTLYYRLGQTTAYLR